MSNYYVVYFSAAITLDAKKSIAKIPKENHTTISQSF